MLNYSHRPIIIASPHERNDALVEFVRFKLPDRRIIQINSPSDVTLEFFKKIGPEYIFFPHWSWIIVSEIYTNFDCIIFHMTDLPYGRGGSPLQNLIIRGHKETKISALKCSSILDGGPIYLKCPLSLHGTAEEILSAASNIISEMILEIVDKKLIPVEQKGDVIEFNRRRPEDGNLFKLSSMSEIYDYIRMLDGKGYPKAFVDTEYTHMEFNDAKLCDGYVEAKVVIRRKSID
jgi:methionyl-tRNA formyltransferase